MQNNFVNFLGANINLLNNEKLDYYNTYPASHCEILMY